MSIKNVQDEKSLFLFQFVCSTRFGGSSYNAKSLSQHEENGCEWSDKTHVITWTSLHLFFSPSGNVCVHAVLVAEAFQRKVTTVTLILQTTIYRGWTFSGHRCEDAQTLHRARAWIRAWRQQDSSHLQGPPHSAVHESRLHTGWSFRRRARWAVASRNPVWMGDLRSVKTYMYLIFLGGKDKWYEMELSLKRSSWHELTLFWNQTEAKCSFWFSE